MDFNPSVMPMFMWQWQAEIYAWRARRNGFDAEVVYEGSNWIELGGQWSVKLSERTNKEK
jgi:hypothetical protein